MKVVSPVLNVLTQLFVNIFYNDIRLRPISIGKKWNDTDFLGSKHLPQSPYPPFISEGLAEVETPRTDPMFLVSKGCEVLPGLLTDETQRSSLSS